MHTAKLLIATGLISSACAWAQAPASPPSRGALLYETHCIACHGTQMHWRENRVATDWASLRRQVARWQGNAGLGWSDGDIEEVTRHLNETIYHFPPGGTLLSQRPPPVPSVSFR